MPPPGRGRHGGLRIWPIWGTPALGSTQDAYSKFFDLNLDILKLSSPESPPAEPGVYHD